MDTINHDPLKPIPEDFCCYVPDSDAVIRSVEQADEKFAEESAWTIWRTIWHTKARRDPTSPRWSEHLPVFTCGGAREIELYGQAIDTVTENWIDQFIDSCPGIRIIPLPKPASLEARIDDNNYHRLAVAWGLSYESFNIGEYDRPSEIENMPRRRVKDISDNFVGKDMV